MKFVCLYMPFSFSLSHLCVFHYVKYVAPGICCPGVCVCVYTVQYDKHTNNYTVRVLWWRPILWWILVYGRYFSLFHCVYLLSSSPSLPIYLFKWSSVPCLSFSILLHPVSLCLCKVHCLKPLLILLLPIFLSHPLHSTTLYEELVTQYNMTNTHTHVWLNS